MLFVALAAWLLLPLAEDGLASQPLLDMAVSAGLATVFVGGLEGLLFELLPLGSLGGERVYQWSRSIWVALFLAAAFLFALLLLNPTTRPGNGAPISALLGAVILFLAFGGAAVLLWAYFRLRSAPRPSGD